MSDVNEIHQFLGCKTPSSWIQAALKDQSLLLLDHANCEKKAASTALNLMYRYSDNFELLNKMSRLAREELRHFEQVLALIKGRGIEFQHVTASRYAGGLHTSIRTSEPGKLIDTLIVGALIEARSCERFACIAPYLDTELQDFYLSLLKSESRHFRDYLALARQAAQDSIEDRVEFFVEKEQVLIESSDSQLRFHSGVPVV
ncbi:MAG: tRNA-(ms[2]io[6]A)-hydroxylase [Porticoccaceae bacterium]